MMSSFKQSTTVLAYGASERGPLHARESRPNQDAWMKASGGFGTLVVVCDGLGSRPKSHFGAQQACQATREAVTRWSKSKDAPPNLLVRLIEINWHLRVHPHTPEETATTCLFALRQGSGKWIVGGLGDGLLAVVTGANWQCYIGERPEDNFANETDALGSRRGSKKWVVEELPATSEPRFALLATDGIGDDLKPEKVEAFGHWFCKKFGPMPPRSRWHSIRQSLRHCPTPRHTDDKTIAVLHSIP